MLISKSSLSDETLVAMLVQGESVAYNTLFERYWEMLYRVAFEKTGDEDAAKDMVQNLFIDIWNRRQTLSIQGSLNQFLFGAVKKQVLNFYRSEGIRAQVLKKAVEHMSAVVASTDELSSYYNLEKVLSEEIDVMPYNMKHAFLLRCENLSVKEIASTLNLAEQTVGNNLTAVMKKLRKRLQTEYPERYMAGLAALVCLVNK
ncbi:sigma-70 family RNA polymerase sigma factor [Mucilaginibacter sp. Bleaf8]|uniref:RNA polymerase sigma factor n=1 Tax=Mucilaginibacter sp. Bleaf8 TaxID=2834430 RepID=UPI001BD0FB43|nr:sigma-70 family RNA polymerase sigma factor [Mucilaginibacter sp. Bleaf8]MBS7563018.1 sigma-70 family RNA polymerase sigma factor [Mucilaginibacter sp. Bleaf8]